jgi:hypothetical protein
MRIMVANRFPDLVVKIRKREGCPLINAMRKARAQDLDAYQEYRALASYYRPPEVRSALQRNDVPSLTPTNFASMQRVIDENAAALAKFNGNPEEEQRKEVQKMAEEFPQVVTKIMQRDGITKMDAMRKAAIEAPEAFAAYQSGGRGHGAPEPVSKAAVAKGAFDARVSQIMKRDGITRLDAMPKARVEYPAEFAALRG